MNWMISKPEAAAECRLHSCICGWAKVTSTKGLQGKKECLKKRLEEYRINNYFLRNKLSQLSEVQQQDKNHSLQDINTPVPVDGEPEAKEPKGNQSQKRNLNPANYYLLQKRRSRGKGH